MSETSTSSSSVNGVPERQRQWRGMTLDELQRARAKALIRREVERANMQNSIDGVRSNVANNGVRALMFSPNQVAHLKTADYVLLGIKLSRWLLNLRGNRRRR